MDLIISSEIDGVVNSKPTVRDFLSDHAFVTCDLKLEKPKAVVKETVFRKIKGIDIEEFKQLINSKLQFDPNKNVEENVCYYNECLKSTLDKFAPLLKKKIARRPRQPWFGDFHKKQKNRYNE